MLKKTSLTFALLAMSACTTSNYYQCPMPPHAMHPHGPMAEKAPMPAPIPPKAWHPESSSDAWRGEEMAPPPSPPSDPVPQAESDNEYHWNADRTPLPPGGHYAIPTPGAAGISGKLTDPLSFPHFCGPGARKHQAC